MGIEGCGKQSTLIGVWYSLFAIDLCTPYNFKIHF